MKIQAERAAELVRQLRARGIRDERVLRVIEVTPRAMFVGEEEAGAAFLDIALPIACGQTISQPFIVAYMTEQLDAGPTHDVLEIGTGSGYQAAVLAPLCRHVYTIERHPELLEAAQARFDRLGLTNITAIAADGAKGWPEPRSFDRIIVTAAASELPRGLIAQLAEGGRMILPVAGRLLGQKLVLVEKMGEGIRRRSLLPVRFVPLVS
ncbi:MAG: protein-L-isoaspartate(D-aspartate) O-methyltransferase [Oricola sp.]